ncbi:MAG: ABC transporter permease [Actinomycetota bacterium]
MEPSEASTAVLEQEISGLENLESAPSAGRRGLATVWAKAWPPLLAAGLALAIWQAVSMSGWKPDYLFPSPGRVLSAMGEPGFAASILRGAGRTLLRGAGGFVVALAIGTVVGLAVARWRILRAAVGSMIAGLQTMPSIAWFPMALLLFGFNEKAILFVLVLGAAPAIAIGLISGIDHVPPVLLRAGRVMGARGLNAIRHVVLPAAIPGYVAGLKQGWAFSWRSLMAGELLVIIPGKISLGAKLHFAQNDGDAVGLMATMAAILVIGIAVDALVFGRIERAIRRRRGLIDHARA